MEEKKIAYKVVRVFDGNMWSTFCTENIRVKYSPNAWTFPYPNTALFLFSDEETANLYAEEMSRLGKATMTVWTCEYEPTKLPIQVKGNITTIPWGLKYPDYCFNGQITYETTYFLNNKIVFTDSCKLLTKLETYIEGEKQ